MVLLPIRSSAAKLISTGVRVRVIRCNIHYISVFRPEKGVEGVEVFLNVNDAFSQQTLYLKKYTTYRLSLLKLVYIVNNPCRTQLPFF